MEQIVGFNCLVALRVYIMFKFEDHWSAIYPQTKYYLCRYILASLMLNLYNYSQASCASVIHSQ